MELVDKIPFSAPAPGGFDFFNPDPNLIGFVYVITNKQNGKQYVGQHIHNSQCGKTACRYKCSGTYIKKAIRKYGMENFTREIVDWEDTREHLDAAEQELIQSLGTMVPNGYNLTVGGEGRQKGSIMTDEQKQKLRGKTPWNKGKHWDDETKRKISQANKGRLAGRNNPSYGGCKPGCTCGRHRPRTEAERRALAQRNKGKSVSAETRKKLSLARMGVSPSNKGKKLNKETMHYE